MTSEPVRLPLRDASGGGRGFLEVSELRNGARPSTGETIALAEGQRYRYVLRDVGEVAGIEPTELFDPDDDTLVRGRITTRQHVGTLVIVVQCRDAVELSAEIEVLPVKIASMDEYRQMLSEITVHAAEAALQGFAPTALEATTATRGTDLLYQRFAVLESQLRSDDFAAAMGRILGNPHVEWRSVVERHSPGGAHPAGSAFSKAFAAPGPRQPWLGGRDRPMLTTIPTSLERSIPETTPDTAPNRFVKHVLETWRGIAQQLHDGLVRGAAEKRPGPVRRGLKAANEVVVILDEILSQPLFREVGTLERIPSNSQVLLKREGYRQLLRTFVLVEAGLEWPWASDIEDVEDIYSPTLRNAATLYEVWSYLTLVDIVGQVCGQHQLANVFTPGPNGLSLLLKRGAASAIRWQTVRRDRALEVLLMFNHQFTAGDESWTAAMHPDCSILIRPLVSTPGPASAPLDIWVHFDAKYRIKGARAFDNAEDGESPARGPAKRDDLLKMHAYRDAIRCTAGAYVLFPGNEPSDFRQHTETLPGLGAFPLRPGSEGAQGVEAITNFLERVLDHVADQASQHERERFWQARIYATPPTHPSLSPVPFLDLPPADTVVLVGYVRGSKHRDWIERTRSYNVRADERPGALRLGSRELGARLVLLYEQVGTEQRVVTLARIGEWRAVSREELIDTDYPEPRGRLYLVTAFDEVPNPPSWLADIAINTLKPAGLALGAPFAVTWLDLLSSVQRS